MSLISDLVPHGQTDVCHSSSATSGKRKSKFMTKLDIFSKITHINKTLATFSRYNNNNKHSTYKNTEQ